MRAALSRLIDFKNLPQQSVFWVVLSIALVITPHLPRFPLWSVFLIAALFIWRLLCIKHPRWLPPKWLLLLIIIVAAWGLFMHFGTVFGKTAGSVFLSLLLAIKLHESRSRRDYMLLIALSFFIIVTNFLFSQSIPTVVFMLLSVIVLLMSMIHINLAQDAGIEARIDTGGNSRSQTLSHRDKLKLASRMLLQALPLMLIMFVLFPRIPGPLWQLPQEKNVAVSGLSDRMEPGNISALIQSSAVAFRAEFDRQPPPQPQLYWRALVLWTFDGRSWERGKHNPTPQANIQPLADPIDYRITLEPHQKDWLFALDMPLDVPENIGISSNFELKARDKINSLYQYRLSSVTEYVIQPQLSHWERSAGLKIPTESNPQTRALGRQLAQQYAEPQQVVSHVLAMFNAEDYHYTLNPPLTPGADSVDQFLFQTRRGFCEHYAGSFALLMRSAGIPARVLLGYQGGTLNPLNQVITVRQSEAHAWVEVWLEGQGWVRIDPTAAIAPQRIERNLNAALDSNEVRPLHMQLNNGVLQQLVFYWDAMDNQWKQWVIGYDDKLQQALLNKLFNQKLPFAEIILYMVISFMLMLLVISLFIVRPWQRPQVEPVQRSYQQFCNKLAKQGVKRQAHEGPLDFAQRAAQQLPQQAASIDLINRLYMRLRYQANASEQLLAQFQRRVKKFRAARVTDRATGRAHTNGGQVKESQAKTRGN